MENETANVKDFMSDSFGDGKLSKELELNESMTIAQQAPDEYTNKLNNIGGQG